MKFNIFFICFSGVVGIISIIEGEWLLVGIHTFCVIVHSIVLIRNIRNKKLYDKWNEFLEREERRMKELENIQQHGKPRLTLLKQEDEFMPYDPKPKITLLKQN